MPRVLLRKVYAGGEKRGPGRTSTQGAGLGQGAGAERGSMEGGLPCKLLRTVLALAGGRR